ncbi:MAG: hypothetical protein RIT26_1400 [Pseudomonadota bacterium]|jgi:hypothetical protein
MNPLHFSALSIDAGSTCLHHLSVTPRQLVIAGWTGRNARAIEHHIEELAALGVPRPSSVPLYYRASALMLTQQEGLEMLGGQTSGEAEPVLFWTRGEWWLTVGSDHTDRQVETYSVAVSKQMCAKPVARTAWRWRDVAEHQDRIELASQIFEDGRWVDYQQGTLAAIRPLNSLRDGFWPQGQGEEGDFMFGGTFAAIPNAQGVAIRPAARTRLLLRDPVRGWSQSHEYAVTPLPVVA